MPRVDEEVSDKVLRVPNPASFCTSAESRSSEMLATIFWMRGSAFGGVISWANNAPGCARNAKSRSRTVGSLRIFGRMLASVVVRLKTGHVRLKADTTNVRLKPDTTHARYPARRARDAHAWPRDRRNGSAGGRENLRVAVRGSVSNPHCDAALCPHAGCDDTCRLHEAVQAGPHAAHDGSAGREGDRDADLSSQLLSQQSTARESLLRSARRFLPGPRSVNDGRPGDAAGCRPEDGEPGADSRVQERPEHLCGHARAPHLESSRLGEDAPAGGNGAGALSIDGVSLVAAAQSD